MFFTRILNNIYKNKYNIESNSFNKLLIKYKNIKNKDSKFINLEKNKTMKYAISIGSTIILGTSSGLYSYILVKNIDLILSL